MMRPYICGPLTELPISIQAEVKEFYSRLAGACSRMLGVRAFVPHEHYDPVKMSEFTPRQIDDAERRIVTTETSVLVVVTLFGPTWGGGIEVEMANQAHVPAILICDKTRLEQRLVSRLLRGNPAFEEGGILSCESQNDAVKALELALEVLWARGALK